MKPIMYHYVRPAAPGMPHFPYLSLANFTRQLDWLAAKHQFVSCQEFCAWIEGGQAPSGVLLTFDDGLRDHIDCVLPALRTRNLWGLFYVPSKPIAEGRLLDVHKVHLALGRLGGAAVLTWLEQNAPNILPPPEERDGCTSHYATQSSDAATKFVKQLFNWRLSAEERAQPLDELLEFAFSGCSPQWHDVYLDELGVRTLVHAGMGVGPHSHSHEAASRLPVEHQRNEIALSCTVIERIGGSRIWGYCHPHGSPDAFLEQTEEAIAEAGCPFAFAVRPFDIELTLADTRRYALPRHNCNAFPHGAVSLGGARIERA